MSSFPGFFPSLPGIRCDRFTETTLEEVKERGEQFFLSHCHEDHMVGLNNLGNYLDLQWPEGETERGRLHCTPTSRSLALSHFKGSLTLDHFSLITVNSPKIVKIEAVSEPYRKYIQALQ